MVEARQRSREVNLCDAEQTVTPDVCCCFFRNLLLTRRAQFVFRLERLLLSFTGCALYPGICSAGAEEQQQEMGYASGSEHWIRLHSRETALKVRESFCHLLTTDRRLPFVPVSAKICFDWIFQSIANKSVKLLVIPDQMVVIFSGPKRTRSLKRLVGYVRGIGLEGLQYRNDSGVVLIHSACSQGCQYPMEMVWHDATSVGHITH